MDRYKLGVFICLYTGIRIGELCALTCKNISLADKTLKIEATMQRIQCTDANSITKTKSW
jgi:integrase